MLVNYRKNVFEVNKKAQNRDSGKYRLEMWFLNVKRRQTGHSIVKIDENFVWALLSNIARKSWGMKIDLLWYIVHVASSYSWKLKSSSWSVGVRMHPNEFASKLNFTHRNPPPSERDIFWTDLWPKEWAKNHEK